MATSEQSIIAKTAERLQQMLPYGQQIAQLQQAIGMIAPQLQASILEKVTTLLTENINDLIPDLPKLKEDLSTVNKTTETQGKSGSKTLNIAMDAQAGVEELKGEFEYMKTRFSP